MRQQMTKPNQPNQPNCRIHLDTDTLLKLALVKLKTTQQRFTEQAAKQIDIANAKYLGTDRKTFKQICPTTREPYYRDEYLWSTRDYIIKTTQHGKILDVERKPQSIMKPMKPKITVKKKRTFTK
jgi:hypothetical protein